MNNTSEPWLNPIRFFSRGLLYEAKMNGPAKLDSIHRVDGEKRRNIPVQDKQWTRIAMTFWRTYHNSYNA